MKIFSDIHLFLLSAGAVLSFCHAVEESNLRQGNRELNPINDDDDAETLIQLCIDSGEPLADLQEMLLTTIFRERGTTPRWTFPTGFPTNGERVLSNVTLAAVGLPPDTKEKFEWFANKLPSSYSVDNNQIPGIPPDFEDFSSLFNMKPPFFHETSDVSTWGYKKW